MMLSTNRLAAALLSSGIVLAPPAHAALLKNIRPGVICRSAEALAKLTLPDGSSRDAGPTASQRAKEIAASGGCVPLDGRGDVIVVATELRRNTSVILFQNYVSGTGATETFYAANIDFVPASLPHTPLNNAMGRLCPDKAERFFAFDSSDKLDMLDAFIATLPKPVQARIESASAGHCEMGWRCVYGETVLAVEASGLSAPWAAYLCRQPALH